MNDDKPFTGKLREELADVRLTHRQGEMLSALLDIAGIVYGDIHFDDEHEQPHCYEDGGEADGCMICQRLAELDRLGGRG